MFVTVALQTMLTHRYGYDVRYLHQISLPSYLPYSSQSNQVLKIKLAQLLSSYFTFYKNYLDKTCTIRPPRPPPPSSITLHYFWVT